MVDRTERIIESDHGFAPVTWTLDSERVEFIWNETEEVFGNSMWFDSICTDEGIPEEWQDEIAQRAEADFFDVVGAAVGDLDPADADPSLVFLGLREMFGQYGVTLDVEPHPWHGDVIARAQERRAGGPPQRDYAPVTWTVNEERVVRLWEDIKNFGPGDAAAGMFLYPSQEDELRLRGREAANSALRRAVGDVDRWADPSLTYLALHEYFRQPYHGEVTFEFAPHPEYGDVLERARRILADGTD
jgi:hypothetical protein